MIRGVPVDSRVRSYGSRSIRTMASEPVADAIVTSMAVEGSAAVTGGGIATDRRIKPLKGGEEGRHDWRADEDTASVMQSVVEEDTADDAASAMRSVIMGENASVLGKRKAESSMMGIGDGVGRMGLDALTHVDLRRKLIRVEGITNPVDSDTGVFKPAPGDNMEVIQKNWSEKIINRMTVSTPSALAIFQTCVADYVAMHFCCIAVLRTNAL